MGRSLSLGPPVPGRQRRLPGVWRNKEAGQSPGAGAAAPAPARGALLTASGSKLRRL